MKFLRKIGNLTKFLKNLPRQLIACWHRAALWKKLLIIAVPLAVIALALFNRPLFSKMVKWAGVIYRAETGVYQWKVEWGYPLWVFFLIRSCFDFWGIFLAWFLTGKVLQKTTALVGANRFKAQQIMNFKKKTESPKMQRVLNRLDKWGKIPLHILMLIFFVPFSPIPVPIAITILGRMRNWKYGLLSLGIVNFIRNSLIIFGLWFYGVNLITYLFRLIF